MNQSLRFMVLITLAVIALAGCTEQSRKINVTLPSSPSEDVSHLLVKPASAAGEFDFDAARDYLPDPNINWVITVEFKEPASGEIIKKLLDYSWIESHGSPIVYGFAEEESHWTFVGATDPLESFSSLKIAWSLWDSPQAKPKEMSIDDLGRFKTAAEAKLSALGEITTRIDRSREEILDFVATLSTLMSECDRDVTLILVAPPGHQFSGHDVWDVMLCLGLDYGDFDLFHWINNSGFGNDLFFSVETSTLPGYFIPQRMASGDGDVDDLIFNFSIPRSSDPVAVFDSMANAIEYAQKRLGGKIVLDSGELFDRRVERSNIERVVQKLNEAGFRPGESVTCQVF